MALYYTSPRMASSNVDPSSGLVSPTTILDDSHKIHFVPKVIGADQQLQCTLYSSVATPHLWSTSWYKATCM